MDFLEREGVLAKVRVVPEIRFGIDTMVTPSAWVKVESDLCSGVQGSSSRVILKLLDVSDGACVDLWNQELGQEEGAMLRCKLDLVNDKEILRVRDEYH